MTFLETANDYLRILRVAPQTLKHNGWLLERLAPVHQVPIDQVDAPKLLAALRAIEAKGEHATAHRVCAFASCVLRYALAAGLRTTPDVAQGLKFILVKPQTTSRAAILDPQAFGGLLAAIGTLDPSPVRDALAVAPYVFVRPSELRGMTWAELDLEKGEWNIPKERMKMRKPFTKFLCAPVVAILAEIQGRVSGDYVFPGRRICKPISENIMGVALRRLGYGPTEVTPHGFRATAATLLREAGFEHGVVEAALAHSTLSVYNRAQYAAAQRELHGAWGAMVERMKDSAAGDTVL